MELIIEKGVDCKSFPKIVIDQSGFSEIIVKDAPKSKYESFCFPVSRTHLRRIFDWLILKEYIEWLPWEYFLYFFEGRSECPADITQIVWLKRSKEGIGIIVNELYRPFKSCDRMRAAFHKERNNRITEHIFIDKNRKPCHAYKKSGTESRKDAQELEDFLASIRYD